VSARPRLSLAENEPEQNRVKVFQFAREFAILAKANQVKDISPLSVDAHADVKKAYAFTCGALEFLKVLRKEPANF
jgi:hypothetical protein